MIRNHLRLCILLFLPITFKAGSALADCGFAPGTDLNPVTSVAIDKTNAPVYDGSGYKQPGCIITSKGEVIGYTSYSYLCNLKSGEKVDLRSSFGCCDTGPDSGDLVCTVRAKGMLGLTSAHGNGVGLAPAEKDLRAIGDLISTLEGDFVFSYYGASHELLEYFADDRFKSAVLSKRERIKAIAQNGKRIDQRGYAANILLKMGNESDEETAQQIVLILKSEPAFDDVDIPAIRKAADYPNQLDKTAPALLEFLKREYYNKGKAEAVFATLEKLGKSLRPYIREILPFEYAWSDRGAFYDFKERVEFRKRMNKIVCDVSAEETNNLKRNDDNHRKASQFTCPPSN